MIYKSRIKSEGGEQKKGGTNGKLSVPEASDATCDKNLAARAKASIATEPILRWDRTANCKCGNFVKKCISEIFVSRFLYLSGPQLRPFH